MIELKVQKKRSKNGDKTYCVLFIDLGYTLKVVTYDIREIAEIIGIASKELYDLMLYANDNDIIYKGTCELVLQK